MTVITKQKVVATIAVVVCVSLIITGWFSSIDLWQKIVNDICCTALGVAFLFVGFPDRVNAVLARFKKAEPEVEETEDTEEEEEEEDDDDDSDIDTDVDDAEVEDSSSCECEDDVEVECDFDTDDEVE